MDLDATLRSDKIALARHATGERSELLRGSLIDRYVILGHLGAGGMGVVYLAYDPELDRKIALKLLRPELSTSNDEADARTRLLREAQALAKLSHPNVVAVHDVGIVASEVWLAMEFVEGITLSEWYKKKRRNWLEVLDIMMNAGRGLAAAHQAGLVHRDFKPDNIMIGADGRVRVMDLGLARFGRPKGQGAILDSPTDDTKVRAEMEALLIRVTQAGAILGTPAYMPPEQWQDNEVGVTADIFAFCVTFWEALTGERPFTGSTLVELASNIVAGNIRTPPRERRIPNWLRKIVERGLQAKPDLRWQTMDALLLAMSQDPRVARTRWILAGITTLCTVAAGYGVAVYQTAQARVCSSATDELRDVWDDSRRSEITRAVLATRATRAEDLQDKIFSHLETYRDHWIATHTSACESHRKGQSSDLLLDRRMACLRQRRIELGAAVDVLTQANSENISSIVETVTGLPPVSLCDDENRLLMDLPQPEDPVQAPEKERIRGNLARLDALERGGRYKEALSALPPELAAAETLKDPSLMAEAHLISGKLHMQLMHKGEARDELDNAVKLGLRGRADYVAAEALTIQIFVVSQIEGRPDEAQPIAELAEAVIARLGNPPKLLALLHNNIGSLLTWKGDLKGSVAEFEKSVEIWRSNEPNHPLHWAAVGNLANSLSTQEEYTRVQDLIRPALQEVEEMYDACHPFASYMRQVLGYSLAHNGLFSEAIRNLEQAAACDEVDLPQRAMNDLLVLSDVYFMYGDFQKALTQCSRAQALVERDPETAPYLSAFAAVRADIEMFRANYDSARSILEETGRDIPLFPHYATRMGLISHLEGDDVIALAYLSQAERHLRFYYDAKDQVYINNYNERALWFFTYARVLRGLARESPQAISLSDQAIMLYEWAGPAYLPQIREILEWQYSAD